MCKMHPPVGPEIDHLFSLAELNFALNLRSTNPCRTPLTPQEGISDVSPYN